MESVSLVFFLHRICKTDYNGVSLFYVQIEPKQFGIARNFEHLDNNCIFYEILPPFQNIRCFKFVKQLYLDIF
jgi:hypothetical protein